MDATSFRSESHIQQQSRRYKLRIQQASPHHIRSFSGDSQQLPLYTAGTGLLLQVPTLVPSEMAATSCNNLSSGYSKDEMVNRPVRGHEDCAQMITSVPNYGVLHGSSLNVSTRASDPQGCGGGWKDLGSQQGNDWMMNYAGGSGVIGVLSNNSRVSCLSVSTSIPHQQVKPPHFDENNDHVQLESRKMEFTHHPIDQSHFDHVVAPALARGNECDDLIPSGSCQPTYLSNLHASYGNYLVSRLAEDGRRWSDGLGDHGSKSEQQSRIMSTDARTHGLSLSLSSNMPKMDVMQFGEQLFGSESSRPTEGNDSKGSDQESKLIKSSNNSGAIPRPSIIRRTSGKSLQDVVSPSTSIHRSSGPLGPFTGYATILKSSRFLKPAQELLGEMCSGTSSISARLSEASSDAISGSFSNSALAGGLNAVVAEAKVKGNSNSSMSSSTFHSSNDVCGDGRAGSSLRESIWPEYQQKKAKLLCLQEEVCRRYKQYHQQMQIVASSFELVSGLDAATPFLSFALKAISRSFRCLKHAISDQLKQETQTLGEEFLSPNATSSHVDAGIPAGLRYMDQSFQKHKPGGANVGFLEPQQHAWRPQRGLPERAVAVLRAWLFEHFLHPYPTDTDKQMLASQTGLSRNQVSNWFINARVRLWKPMVEEIHTLETKGVAESNQTSRKNDATSCQDSRQPDCEPSMNKLATANSILSKQVDRSVMGFSVGNEEQFRIEQWDQERRPTSAFHPLTNMDESSVSFLPYHRSGLDIGSLGTVSLTLGLRHGVDNVQHRHQVQQHHEDQLMRLQFGGQMVHDFTI